MHSRVETEPRQLPERPQALTQKFDVYDMYLTAASSQTVRELENRVGTPDGISRRIGEERDNHSALVADRSFARRIDDSTCNTGASRARGHDCEMPEISRYPLAVPPGGDEQAPSPDEALLLRDALVRPRYPRSATYDPEWLLHTMMGPNVLWQAEALCKDLSLEPGMRVLDLACGRAASSIFLAREFGVTVWAVDTLVSPTSNWKQIEDAGVDDRVFPLRADARSLPLPKDFFHAVVCIGGYHYFGTDNLYLRDLMRFVRNGSRIGITVPGLTDELGSPPQDLAPSLRMSFEGLHSPAWWRAHWERTPHVEVEAANMIPDGWRDWADWYDLCVDRGVAQPRRLFEVEAQMVRRDAGKRFGLVRAIARVIHTER
jgi:cyclopropane fatty-acyl-phospholipid synthase-like methyltransferase